MSQTLSTEKIDIQNLESQIKAVSQFPRLNATSLTDFELYLFTAFNELFDPVNEPFAGNTRTHAKLEEVRFGRVDYDAFLKATGTLPLMEPVTDPCRVKCTVPIEFLLSKEDPTIIEAFRRFFPFIHFGEEKRWGTIRPKKGRTFYFECVLYLDDFPAMRQMILRSLELGRNHAKLKKRLHEEAESRITTNAEYLELQQQRQALSEKMSSLSQAIKDKVQVEMAGGTWEELLSYDKAFPALHYAHDAPMKKRKYHY